MWSNGLAVQKKAAMARAIILWGAELTTRACSVPALPGFVYLEPSPRVCFVFRTILGGPGPTDDWTVDLNSASALLQCSNERSRDHVFHIECSTPRRIKAGRVSKKLFLRHAEQGAHWRPLTA